MIFAINMIGAVFLLHALLKDCLVAKTWFAGVRLTNPAMPMCFYGWPTLQNLAVSHWR